MAIPWKRLQTSEKFRASSWTESIFLVLILIASKEDVRLRRSRRKPRPCRFPIRRNSWGALIWAVPALFHPINSPYAVQTYALSRSVCLNISNPDHAFPPDQNPPQYGCAFAWRSRLEQNRLGISRHRSSFVGAPHPDAPLQSCLQILQRVRRFLEACAARPHVQAGGQTGRAGNVGGDDQRWRAAATSGTGRDHRADSQEP